MDILTIVLGLAGATAATFAARRIAARLGRSPAAAFGLSAFFLSGLLYVAALQTLMLYGLPSGMLPVARAPEATFLAYAVLAAIFSIAALGIGCLWMLQDPENQMWHDKIAGTLVVKVPREVVLA